MKQTSYNQLIVQPSCFDSPKPRVSLQTELQKQPSYSSTKSERQEHILIKLSYMLSNVQGLCLVDYYSTWYNDIYFYHTERHKRSSHLALAVSIPIVFAIMFFFCACSSIYIQKAATPLLLQVRNS